MVPIYNPGPAAPAAAAGWARRFGTLEAFYPRNAASAFVQSVGGVWVWSAYNTIATLGSDFVPHLVHLLVRIRLVTTAIDGTHLEYEVATGIAGSEVAIGRFTDAFVGSIVLPGVNTQAYLTFGRTLPLGPRVIPSGTRLSHRVRVSNGAAFVVEMYAYLGGYDGGAAPPLDTVYALQDHLQGDHNARTVTQPSGATLSIMGAAFPNYGPWTPVLASAPQDLLIWGAARRPSVISGGNVSMYMEIGVGAAGLEQPIGRVGFPGGASSSTNLEQLYRPAKALQGERVAARLTGAAATMECTLFWEEVTP